MKQNKILDFCADLVGTVVGTALAGFGCYMIAPGSTASGTLRDTMRSDGRPKKAYDSKFAARWDNLTYVMRGGDLMCQYKAANGKWYNGHGS